MSAYRSLAVAAAAALFVGCGAEFTSTGAPGAVTQDGPGDLDAAAAAAEDGRGGVDVERSADGAGSDSLASSLDAAGADVVPRDLDAGRADAREAEGGSSSGGDDGGRPEGCALVMHSNGLGQSWTDCAPLGTFDLSEAMAACTAHGATYCGVDNSCAGATICATCVNVTCACWTYTGAAAGRVATGSACPTSSGNAWQ